MDAIIQKIKSIKVDQTKYIDDVNEQMNESSKYQRAKQLFTSHPTD